MEPFIALDHLANLFGAAVGVAGLAAALAKLFWRGELAGVPWRRLAGWGALAGGVATLAGLLVFGQDGRMATYTAMIAATALALLRVGFGRR